jgi:soluble lytic murein transglycosylase
LAILEAMKKPRFLITLGLCAVVAGMLMHVPAGHTAPPSAKPAPQAQAREDQTLRAVLRLVDQGSWSAAKTTAQTGGADLVRFYEWLVLTRTDEVYALERYTRFLSQNPDWPATRRIRAQAERAITESNPTPQAILALYPDGTLPVSARGMVAYVRALEAMGDQTRARRDLNAWFVDASLSGDEQALILANLRSLLDRPVMLARLDELIMTEQKSSAKALARAMGGGAPELLAARLALDDRAAGADAAVRRVPAALQNDPGLLYERIKFRRRAQDRAAPVLELFNQLPSNFRPVAARPFFNEQQALIYRLLAENNPNAAYQVATKRLYSDDDRFARGQAEWFAGYIALSFLQQPGRAFKHFDALYDQALSPLTKARAAYWAGEASTRLGYKDVATAWYQSAARYRANYYGQRAAGKLGREGSLAKSTSGGPPTANRADQIVMDRSSLPRMAELLRAAGDTVRAEMFLHRLADHYADRPGVVRLIVDLALRLNLTSTAVKISREAAMDGIDFADHVYPVLPGLGTGDVEPALVYAIIRQESGFDVDAVSSVGAKGLMQLMPATAKAVARSEKQPHRKEWLTSKPNHNVRLGSAYLRQLIDQFDDYALVAAAYNAGPSRVRTWLEQNGDPRSGEITLDDWIERIPFYETRNYVQRVMESVAIYRAKANRL